MEHYNTFKVGKIDNPIFGSDIDCVLAKVSKIESYRAEFGFAYIYALYDGYSKDIFYIGKTISPVERLLSHWKEKYKICKKLNAIYFLKNEGIPLFMEIIDRVPSSEWEFWEKHYISLYKSFGLKLANVSEGGCGADYYKHTDISKEKIRLSGLGRSHTSESKKLMSESRIGIIFSDEHLKNLSISHLGQKNENLFKAVVQIDCFNGNVINEYSSIREAELITGVANNAITRCCKGKGRMAGNFYWIYKTNLGGFVFKKYKRGGWIPITRRAVLQLDKDGVLVCEYDSIMGASKSLGKSGGGRSNITKSIENGRIAYGYLWKFKN